MGNPTVASAHVDAALTNLSIAYIQDQKNFVADRVFPNVPVQYQSDKYYVFNKNDFLRDEAEIRVPGAESVGTGFRLDSTNTYNADVYAVHQDISLQTLANQDPGLNLVQSAMRFVTNKMLIKRERLFASNFFSTSVWGTDVTGGSSLGSSDFIVWDDQGLSNPREDVQTGKETVLQNTGFEPNVLVVGYKVHSALIVHPMITEALGTTQPTNEALANYFGVEDYLVSKANYATNVEGGTAAYSFAVGNNALLVHRTKTPGIAEATAGVNFVWNRLTGMNDLGVNILKYDGSIPNSVMSTREATRIEGQFAFDMKVTASDLGYFFSGAAS
jgi:hypothetical protein